MLEKNTAQPEVQLWTWRE